MGMYKKYFKGYDKTKTTHKLTYEELYEVMKEGTYPCGEPFLTGKGIMHCIQFPAVDKYLLQVSITGKTITVAKINNGIGGFAKEAMLDSVTDGWFSMLNKENVDLNQMTEVVTAEISRLLEEKGLLLKKNK